mgnify:CR=1 FL=1
MLVTNEIALVVLLNFLLFLGLLLCFRIVVTLHTWMHFSWTPKKIRTNPAKTAYGKRICTHKRCCFGLLPNYTIYTALFCAILFSISLSIFFWEVESYGKQKRFMVVFWKNNHFRLLAQKLKVFNKMCLKHEMKIFSYILSSVCIFHAWLPQQNDVTHKKRSKVTNNFFTVFVIIVMLLLCLSPGMELAMLLPSRSADARSLEPSSYAHKFLGRRLRFSYAPMSIVACRASL